MKSGFILTCLALFASILYSQEEKGIVYLLYESNPLIKINLDNKEFRIFKHEFIEEKARTEYRRNYNLGKVPYQSFYYSFVYYKKPKKVGNISDLKITPINEISKAEIKINQRSKIYFIVKNKCNSYSIYETTMDFEE